MEPLHHTVDTATPRCQPPPHPLELVLGDADGHKASFESVQLLPPVKHLLPPVDSLWCVLFPQIRSPQEPLLPLWLRITVETPLAARRSLETLEIIRLGLWATTPPLSCLVEDGGSLMVHTLLRWGAGVEEFVAPEISAANLAIRSGALFRRHSWSWLWFGRCWWPHLCSGSFVCGHQVQLITSPEVVRNNTSIVNMMAACELQMEGRSIQRVGGILPLLVVVVHRKLNHILCRAIEKLLGHGHLDGHVQIIILGLIVDDCNFGHGPRPHRRPRAGVPSHCSVKRLQT
mmetsp:Transcript_35867/g.76130  ORF Transcript_35867/g.76130 Transcript_35867/m.76130 type:complete len:288 (-) Transcript_35867:2-865(-)